MTQRNIEELGDEPDRKGDAKRGNTRTSSGAARKSEAELRERLLDCFNRIAESLHERGDEELAELVGEDGPVMAAGLVSLTRPIKVLRVPLLALATVIQPVLAFGRVGRILAERWADRRAARQAEHEAAPRDDQP